MNGWWSKNGTNVLAGLILCLVGAFFTDFQLYKSERRDFAKRMDERMIAIEISTVVNNRDIEEIRKHVNEMKSIEIAELRKQVNELCSLYNQLYLKINTRSGNKKDTIR